MEEFLIIAVDKEGIHLWTRSTLEAATAAATQAHNRLTFSRVEVRNVFDHVPSEPLVLFERKETTYVPGTVYGRVFFMDDHLLKTICDMCKKKLLTHDFYTMVAAKALEVQPIEVTIEQRAEAKQALFIWTYRTRWPLVSVAPFTAEEIEEERKKMKTDP